MTDTLSQKTFSDTELQQAMLDEQALIAEELQTHQDVIPLPYNPTATVLHIPKIQGNSEAIITLEPRYCRTRQLIFGAFNAAAYLYLMTDDFPELRKIVRRKPTAGW